MVIPVSARSQRHNVLGTTVGWNYDFEILSVLRNLKIIGIFTRLSIRDKKNHYLKLIPNAWNLIELRIKNNKNFSELEKVLNNNFSKEVRIFK